MRATRQALWPRRAWAAALCGLGLTFTASAAPSGATAAELPSTAASAAAGPALPPPPTHRLWVVSHGWHTGLVLRAADVPAEAWPARADFDDARYFEIGWGDRDFYRASEPGAWLALKAVLWPRPGVLHVVALTGAFDRGLPGTEIVAVDVSPPGFQRLLARLRDSHALDRQGRPVPLGPGLYGQSRFYASNERFHAFKTCNLWVATLLQTAGVPVSLAQALTAADLMVQLRAPPREPQAQPASAAVP